MERITNADQKINSLQISRLNNVSAGDTDFGLIVLLKNLTEESITVEIRPAGQQNYISTSLSSGWNPELVTGVKGVTEGQLQYGY